MSAIEVFDPLMCCSTGVCGPSVDPALATFAADLGALEGVGISVVRHNLSQEPKAFVDDAMVRELLHEHGDDVLPLVVVDGELRSSGRYPSRDELETWVRAETASDLDPTMTELVALGAAVGANCETCFKFHYNQARLLGVNSATMAAVVRVAQAVKDAPARSMLDLAAKLLGVTPEALGRSTAPTPSSTTSEQSDVAAPCCSPAVETSAQSTSTDGASAPSCCGDRDTSGPLSVTAAGEGSNCCG